MSAIGVLGTGTVEKALARRLVDVGYHVMVGARHPNSASLSVFADHPAIRTGSFAETAASADLLINATNGLHSLDALRQVGADQLAGKTLIDVANELIPVEHGFPQPAVTADHSLGQAIQVEFPDTHVVKSLCTMANQVMVDPSIVPGDHVVFLSGDDVGAKDRVREMLAAFGWRPVQMVDLGGIDTAASVELLMSLWMRVSLVRGRGAPRFNWAIHSA